MTNQARECIREAARRYVRDEGPIPPTAVLERVARIILQATTSGPPEPTSNPPTGSCHRSEAA